MRIVIETGHCRNSECGDWFQDADGTLQIRTTPMPIDSQIAVAFHEITEWRGCDENGITDGRVTKFDAKFLKEQNAGLHPKDAESGNDPRAPYYKQHQEATFIEQCFCAIRNLSWKQHEKNVFNRTQ